MSQQNKTDLQFLLATVLQKAQALRNTTGARDAQLRHAVHALAVTRKAVEQVEPGLRASRWPAFGLRAARKAILQSGLFDWGYYYAAHPELRKSRMHPVDHYLRSRPGEATDPHPLFDGRWYLRQYPDVASRGMSPLLHYARHGAREKRSPHPLFDVPFYLSRYPDVAASGVNPLRHYIRFGGLEGRQPHQLFDAQAYLDAFPELRELGMSPLEHYCRFGAWLPHAPHKLFDPDHYLAARPELLQSGTAPLVHFLKSATVDLADPSADFSVQAYLQAHPELQASGQNPLLHYATFGGDLPAAGAAVAQPPVQRLPLPPVADEAPHPAQQLQDFLYDEFGLEECTRITSGMRHFRLPMDPQRRETDAREDDLGTLVESVAAAAGAVPAQEAEAPQVSIIVPAYNQLRFTLACLYSVLAHQTRYSYELIVADDCSTDATAEVFSRGLPHIRHVRPDANLGFLRNCNHAARQARGRVLVFLNNDTYVLPGWLDQLVEVLDAGENVGLAGSKLIFSDGRLQESGGLVFADGSGWNYGRFDDPRKPDYCYLRDTDYVSGASIAIRTDLWQQLGGFSEYLEKAYYEDTDLAMKVRQAGQRVVVQPLSQLIHFEGISSGTDITAGVKRYQVVNGETFRERWKDALASHGACDSKNLPVHRGSKGTVLVIDARTPMPDRDSGSMDTFQYLRILKSFGYHVLFAPENLVHAGRYSAMLQRIGVQVLYAPFWMGMDQLLEAWGPKLDHVLVYRAPVAEAVYEKVRRHAPRAKVIFDTVDLHFLRLQREAELAGDAEAIRAAERMKKLELDLVRKADATIVLSRFEMDLLRELTPGANLFEVPIVREVPAASGVPFEERQDIVFVGGFEHQPNIDAVQWFVAQVVPQLQARGFAGRFIVVGSSMPAHIKALERPGVVMRGFVQDLEAFFGTIRLSVAPLRYGAGLKGKVISSLSYGVPVVATRVAVEGGGFSDGENVLVADDPAAMADAILRLYGDADLWNRQSQAGRRFFIENFSVESVAGKLAGLLQAVSR